MTTGAGAVVGAGGGAADDRGAAAEGVTRPPLAVGSAAGAGGPTTAGGGGGRGRRGRRTGWAVEAGGLGACLVLATLGWDAYARSSGKVPDAGAIAERVRLVVGSGDLGPDLLPTARAVIVALTGGAAVGWSVGYALWRWPRLGLAAEPFLVAGLSVPLVLFYPALFVVLGINERPIMLLAGIMASIPCALSTWVGLGSVPAVQLKLADTLGLSRAARLLRVAAPSAAPHIVAGLRLAAVYVVVGVIAMEFVAAPSGLGYRIRYLYEVFDDTGMYAYIAIVFVLAVAMAAALAVLELVVAAHRPRPRGVSEPPPDAPRPGVRGLAAIGVVLVAAWWVVGAANPVVPTPPATLSALVGLFGDQEFRTNLVATAGKVLLAALLGTALGAAAGFALGRVTMLRRLLQAYLDALNAVPKLILYPALVGILGFGPRAQVAMGALFAFFPVMTNVAVGARSVPAVLDDLARSLELGRVRRLATVVLPAVRRPLLVGCRLGTSLAVIGVVVSEIVATRIGLGRVVMRTYGQGQYEEMMAVILTMVLLASLLALGLRALERRAP